MDDSYLANTKKLLLCWVVAVTVSLMLFGVGTTVGLTIFVLIASPPKYDLAIHIKEWLSNDDKDQ